MLGVAESSVSVPFVARRSMSAVATPTGIYFLGGVGAQTLSDSILDVSDELWHWDALTSAWTHVPKAGEWPAPRRCPGFLATNDGLQLWGGSGLRHKPDGSLTHTFLNDWWVFSPHTLKWSKRLGPHGANAADSSLAAGPSRRYTPVFQSVADKLFLFSGYTEDGLGKRKLNDAWLHDGQTWSHVPECGHAGYRQGADWPGLRYGSMSTADAHRVYVCGGFSDDGDHIDVWAFDVVHRTWELLSGEDYDGPRPAPRYCAAMVWHRNSLLLFGGRSRRHPKLNFNDLWRFDLRTRTWEEVHGNRLPHQYDSASRYPGYHAKAAHAVIAGGWHILGGEGVAGHVSDFWRLDLSTLCWKLILPARNDDPILW